MKRALLEGEIFFEKVSFHGGTALRILHGLDRFSLDLDFSLIKKDENFELNNYMRMVQGSSKNTDASLKHTTNQNGSVQLLWRKYEIFPFPEWQISSGRPGKNTPKAADTTSCYHWKINGGSFI
ncbi:MAG: nucleotidyl transferase AbiEii/AbiGii toxin family protein [Treponema sp.]|jgi:predicted nucleotidyltransferase component of viral defense system|nr:nucleotidyl transferase AbiEii/AbiGii toxin family protein [Treponema sp.]